MEMMRPTRIRDLAVAVAGTAAVSYPLMQPLYRWFPPLTIWTGVSLLVIAIGEAGWGYYVRSRISAGKVGPGRLHPLIVARSVSGAKASAWVGASVLGFWAGVLTYLLQRRTELQIAAQDTVGAVVAAVSALALLAAAVWLEHCCRSPNDLDERFATGEMR